MSTIAPADAATNQASATNPRVVTAAADPQHSAHAASAAKAARTTVTVTLSPEAFKHYEAAAKREHRSLPNYMFVRLEELHRQDKNTPASAPTSPSTSTSS